MKRIMVIGIYGSGKTAFSIKLNNILNLNLIHLDPLFYKTDGSTQTTNQWERLINDLINKENWIIDGNYPSTIKLRLQRADTIIFLDLPRYKCLWNITKRVFKHYFRLGPIESIINPSIGFLFRTYWRVIRMNKKRKDKYYRDLRQLNEQNLFIFKSQKQSQIFLNNLKSNR